MITFYEREPFVEKISVLIDQNSGLWSKTMRIKNRELFIRSWEQVAQKCCDHVMILITTDAYMDIYHFIMAQSVDSHVVCCRYPQNYYSYTAFIQKLFYHLPISRQLMFRAGKEPHENALALVSFLENEYSGKRFRIVFLGKTVKNIWADHNRIKYLDADVIHDKSGLIQNIYFCWLYATSAAIFYEDQPIGKGNKKQLLIFLNHGTIPLKDVHDVLRQPKEVNYGVCPSANCAQIYQEQYGIPQSKQFYMIPPRCSFLRKVSGEIRQLVPFSDEQVIFWLPTFRSLSGVERQDSLNTNPVFLFQEEQEWNLLNEKLAENHQILLIKMHPKEKYQLCLPQEYRQIVRVTDDMLMKTGLILQEILGDTSALITDYSGIAFEYLLLDKPIGYVTADMDDYRREFAFDDPFQYMPGEKINTPDDFFRFLDHVEKGKDDFRYARERLKSWLFQENTQENAAEELVALIEKS